MKLPIEIQKRDPVNDPYPGYFVSGIDDEGRDILSPVSALTNTSGDDEAALQTVSMTELQEALRLLPSVMRASMSNTIISAINEQAAIIDRMRRTSKARRLAFEAASTARPQPSSMGDDILDLYRMSVQTDVTMEGVHFMGVNRSALKRAWEADRAALARPQSAAVRDGWQKVPEEPPIEFLKSINADNQVLVYENGRYYNAWFEFDTSEGGWLWTDEADSEPNPSHYMPLPAAPALHSTQEG